MITPEHFGRAVKLARKFRNMSQDSLAHYIGHKQTNYVSALENGHKSPNFSMMVKLSTALNLPMWKILKQAAIVAETEARYEQQLGEVR